MTFCEFLIGFKDEAQTRRKIEKRSLLKGKIGYFWLKFFFGNLFFPISRNFFAVTKYVLGKNEHKNLKNMNFLSFKVSALLFVIARREKNHDMS